MGSGPGRGGAGVAEVGAASLVAALGGADAVAVRDGTDTVVAAHPDEVVVASGAGALAALDDLAPGWWAGFLTYDLGRAIERVEPRTPPGPLPDLVLARFATRLVVDAHGHARIEGDARDERAERLRAAWRAAPGAPRPDHPDPRRWRSSLDRAAFTTHVRAIRELLAAGACYQVNLTRTLTCDEPIDPVALHAALAAANPAPHAAFVRLHGVSVVSASPERFLRWDGPVVTTRPIKGTGVDAAALAASPKDRAENVMIVDLARNDLGRIAVPGSVHVPDLLRVEEHPGLLHLVSTVAARRRGGVGPGALVRATFPPASVTGAPKPRVLQVIEDLEPVRRGVYCGAVGWIDTERDAGDLSVAIRTFTVTDDGATLGVGAGIVADSDPDAEWRETELKAARLLQAAGGAR